MGNHVHLLIETPVPNLGRGMQGLHGLYARVFNAKYGRTGHRFQSRYGSSRKWDAFAVRDTAAYLAMNPVEAGFCQRPEDWPWSSYGAICHGREPTWLDSARLLDHLEVAGSGSLDTFLADVRPSQRR